MQEVKLTLLNDLPACRSVHICNGAYQCKLFDGGLLHDYVRDDGDDLAKMKEIFAKEQARNEADGGTVLLLTVSYVFHDLAIIF
jgi:hypothetical protein